MGMSPASAPEPILSLWRQTWFGREKELCELSYTLVFGKSVTEAEHECANVGPGVIRSVSDAQLEMLRRTLQ